jgi:hypothetical protein
MHRAMHRLFVLLLLSLIIVAEETVVDRWYVGELNGQPAVGLHLVSTPIAGGGRSTVAEMNVVLRRPMGSQVFRIEVKSRQELTEDEQGRIIAFRFDQDENGQRTAARGQVKDGTVQAEIHRLGRVERQDIALGEGTRLMGVVAQQALLAQASAEGKAEVAFSGLELVSNRVALVQSTGRAAGSDPDGGLVWTVTSDLMPIPTRMVVDRRGELLRMGMDLGLFKIEVRRADGPVALLGAEVDAAGLVQAVGTPKGGERQRYRLPTGAQAAADEFQTVEGSVVTVAARAEPKPLVDPTEFLKAEPQLETDDQQMRAWVMDIIRGHADPLDRADALRLAVRSHITQRDLTTADGSALETFRNRKGDCSEHANFLAAALRIAGIPSRVEVGIIYSSGHGGWVGHAWNSAYVDGRWVLFDAAFPGVARSNYIKMGTASGGDPARSVGALLSSLTTIMGKQIESLD